MNISRATVVLRPRGVAEAVDLALRLVVIWRRPIARLAALLLLPGLALCVAAQLVGVPAPAIAVVALLASLIAEGVFLVAYGRLLFAEEVGAGWAIGGFLRRSLAFAVGQILGGLVIAVGLLLLLPGMLAGGRFLFVPLAVLLEGAGPFTALARSVRMSRGVVGQSLGFYLALLSTRLTIAGLVVVLARAGAEDLLQLGPPSDGFVGWSVLVGALLASPWAAAVRFVGYLDVRTRREGWDIQVRFAALAAAAGQERVAS